MLLFQKMSNLNLQDHKNAVQQVFIKAYLAQHTQYKCIQGSTCNQRQGMCPHLHPGQEGYESVKYYQSDIHCKYESESTACRKKCGQANGRYCPYKHCDHKNFELITIRCFSPYCQRHCPYCF